MKKERRFQINFNDGINKGVYYINYKTKKEAIKEKEILKKSVPGVKWFIRIIKVNKWILK